MNAFLHQFWVEMDEANKQANVYCELVYDEDEEHNSRNKLYNEVDEMIEELTHNWSKYTLNSSFLDDDFQDFLGFWSKERKVAEKAWDEYIARDHAFSNAYDALIEFLEERFHSKKREEEPAAEPVWEVDDLRAETIQRYESGIGSPFFDIDDWHIIMDNYQHKFDEENKAKALEKAFMQHPENPTLLLRKAQEEMGKHNYKNALDWVSKAEKTGPPYHPNFYMIKANLLCQMHAPDQAIPLYNKLINAEGMGLEWFHENALLRLIDIYSKQNNLSECIRLSKELLDMDPDDTYNINRLCEFYRQAGMFKETEELANRHLEQQPECALCLAQLAYLKKEEKDFYKAIKLFKEAYAIDEEENYSYLYEAGKVYQELKHYADAIGCFERCVFHYHFGIEYHIAAAACYKALNMPYAAEYHQSKIIELQPERTNASLKREQSEN
ncbi:MAG: hypothetical protein WCH34_12560 [Bacteroidota bacterium]